MELHNQWERKLLQDAPFPRAGSRRAAAAGSRRASVAGSRRAFAAGSWRKRSALAAEAAVLAVILAVCLAGCGRKEDEPPDTVQIMLENPESTADENASQGTGNEGQKGMNPDGGDLESGKNPDAGSQEEAEGRPGDPAGGFGNQSGDGTGGFASQSGGDSAAVRNRVLSQIGLEPDRKRELTEVQKLLDDSGIHYTGFLNQTGERLDLELGEDIRMVFLQVSTDIGEHKHFELVLSWDGTFDKNVFQEGYLHQYDVTMDEPFFSGTDERVMDEYEISNQGNGDLTSLQIARNELYARHGRIFQDPFVQAVFETKSWYQPRYTAAEYDQKAETFSEIEQQNLKTILGMEKMFQNIPAGENYSPGRPLLSGSWLDLDGDGQEERIRYEVQTESGSGCGSYRLEVDGQEESGAYINLHPCVDVAETGKGGSLLVVRGDGPSEDPWNECFLYGDHKLVRIGGMEGAFQGIDDAGALHVRAQNDFFQTCVLPLSYKLDPEKKELVLQDQDFYEYGNEAVVREEILLYTDKQFTQQLARVPAGERVVIEGSDLKTGVRIRRISTGETGWLKCREHYICTMPDGQEMESVDVFDGLPFFG